jgi:hypothetical protein
MKICPFCQEEIKDGALKCRHCCSSIVELELAKAENSLRFLKIAGSLIALVVSIGAILYGFDIKQASKQTREARDEAKRARDEANELLSQAKKEHEAIIVAKAQIDLFLKQAGRSVGQINQILADAQKNLSNNQERDLRNLQAAEPAKFRELSEADSQKFGRKLWPIGAILRVRFLDGSDEQKTLVRTISSRWLEYANIKLVYIESGTAEIRVSFSDQGTWSYVGTDALGVPDEEPTINFGWLTLESPEVENRRAVLHEFGHVLGLVHEEQIPNAQIPWDEEKVAKVFKGPPNFWTEHQIKHLLRKYDYPTEKKFDPKSIMLFFPVTNDLTIGDFELSLNYELSKMDEEFISVLYPKNAGA